MYGCAFGNASTPTLGGSSFVLSDSEVGRVTLPFTFRWTVSHCCFVVVIVVIVGVENRKNFGGSSLAKSLPGGR